MSYSKNRRSHAGPLRVVVAILGSLAVVGVLICAGIGLLAYRAVAPAFQGAVAILEDTAESQTLAQGFLEALRDNRLDEAFGRTTDGFRSRNGRQELEDFRREHPALRELGPLDLANLTFGVQDLHTRNFWYPLSESDGNSVTLQVTVVKEGNALRVDELAIVPRQYGPEATTEQPSLVDRMPGSGSDLDGVQGAATAFLRALEAGSPETAYMITSDAFRKRMDQEALAKFLEDHPCLERRHQLEGFLLSPGVSSAQSKYLFSVQGDDGRQQRFELEIVQIGSQWKVDNLRKVP